MTSNEEFQSTSICPHPSGNPTPSQADIQMTRTIRDAAKGVNIALHDHLIVAKSGTVSFADQGLL